MPFLPAALSVTAMTMATSPFLPLVMNCLTPLSTYSSPSLPFTNAAVVLRPPASEPTCGSVRQKAPSISPRASGLRKRCFWSSLPKAIRIEQTGQLLTLTTVDVPPSPAAISSRISASAR
jgi:hypothetical protein